VNEDALAHWGLLRQKGGGKKRKRKKRCGMRHYIQYGGAEKFTVIKDPRVCQLVL